MGDNASPFLAAEYDEQIHKTVPFYESFHDSTLDLVRTVNPAVSTWLDTGCGTGSFVKKASAVFSHTSFFLADPSKKMLELAKAENGNVFEKSTAALDFPADSFDVITAMLSHHYLSEEERRRSTENCLRMLKPGGLYITFENIRPLTPAGVEIFMKRWLEFKRANGVVIDDSEHYGRFGREYMPITVADHLALLGTAGFQTAELFWLSYMQAGFFAKK